MQKWAVLGPLAAIIALTPSIASASAADAWTVTPGGAFSASGPITVTNVTQGTEIDCTLAAKGEARIGSGLDRFGLVKLTDTAFTCSGGPTVTPRLLPWEMHAEAYDATQAKMTGDLTLVEFEIDMGSNCVADVTGPADNPGIVDAAHTNTDAVLALSGGDLVVNYVTPACENGVVAIADKITLVGLLTLSPSQTITSP